MLAKRRSWSFISLMIVMTLPLMAAPRAMTATQFSLNEQDAPWPMWRQNPSHTGAAVGEADPYLSVKWRFMTNGPVISSASAANGRVYVGSYDHNLYCIDAQNGSLVWKYEVNSPILSSPAIANEMIYVGPDDGNIYCFNSNNGSLVWMTYAGGRILNSSDTWFMIRSSPTVVGGRLYVGALDGKVYCLEAKTGNILWTYETGDSIFSSPAVAGGKVYIGSADRYLYALNAADGNLLWRFDCGYLQDVDEYPRHGVFSSPTVAEDLGLVYVFSNALAYYAVNMETGVLSWQYSVPYNGTFALTQWISPTYASGKLYFQDDFYQVCVDAKTGKGPLWLADLGAFGWSSAAYADGKIFGSGGYFGGVNSLDASNGAMLSYVSTEGSVISSSPSVAYGNVYVGSYDDCSLYCLSASVPEPPKTETTITYELSSTTVTVGSYITINGTINPAPASLPPVTAVFTRPNGTSVEITTAAVSSGYFELSYQPDVEGVWNVRAYWSGDVVNQGASTPELVFTANSVPSSGHQQQSTPLGSVPYELLVATAIFLTIMVFEVAFLYSRKKRIQKTKPTANTVRITIVP